MFTVMHRDNAGNETFYSATSVQWVDVAELDYGPGLLLTLTNDMRVHIPVAKAVQVHGPKPEAFVMNENGKTVGRYLM